MFFRIRGILQNPCYDYTKEVERIEVKRGHDKLLNQLYFIPEIVDW